MSVILQQPVTTSFFEYFAGMYWLFPWVFGLLFILILLYIRNKRSHITVITISGVFSFTMSLLALSGVYSYSLWLKGDLNTGHVFFNGLYLGWHTSWYPMLICSAFIVIILIIAAKSVSDLKKSSGVLKAQKNGEE